MALDLVHLASGSIWLGGSDRAARAVAEPDANQGRAEPLRPSRVQVLTVVVPRFSNVAFVSVIVLLATGTAATIIHMPAVNALWETGYGVAILVKIGLLASALCASARSTCCGPSRRLVARARQEPSAASAPRGCCAG